MPASPQTRTGEGGTAPLRQPSRALVERSLRFTVTVMAPIGVILVVGPHSWLIFAMVSAIVAFAGDAGGQPLRRLGWMATGPLALALGLSLGEATLAHPLLVILLSMAAGLAYGLVETAHPHLLLATRFFAFGIVLAGLVVSPGPNDYLAIGLMLGFAWIVSLAFDRFEGQWKPLTVPPFADILPSLHRGQYERWSFGAAVSIAVGLALLTAWLAGSVRPSWACLAILMVMRSEVASSLRLAIERVAGTFGGVLVAALVVHFTDHRAMLVAMALAAFIRWPAQQVHNALGVFCLTVFILLMIEIVTPDRAQAALLLQERFYDTLMGAVAAGLGLAVYRILLALHNRPTGGAP